MKKVVIAPSYNFLREYIEDVPRTFDSIGTVLHSKRNIIREDCVKGTRLVIKSFKRIYLTNRIRYTYFYPSKAQRAFENAEILLRKGFNTPRPIAYVEITRNGLIDQMFFICEYIDFQPLDVIRELSFEMSLKLLQQIAGHAFRLHQNNIYHVDYSVGNILFKDNNDKYELALIDNNRMQFGGITFERGIRSFERLGLPVEHLTWIGKEYARLWNVNEVIGIERLFLYKRNQLRKTKIKESIKNSLSGFKAIRGVWAYLKNAC